MLQLMFQLKHRAVSKWFLNIFKDRSLTRSLRNIFQCESISKRKYFYYVLSEFILLQLVHSWCHCARLRPQLWLGIWSHAITNLLAFFSPWWTKKSIPSTSLVFLLQCLDHLSDWPYAALHSFWYFCCTEAVAGQGCVWTRAVVFQM